MWRKVEAPEGLEFDKLRRSHNQLYRLDEGANPNTPPPDEPIDPKLVARYNRPYFLMRRAVTGLAITVRCLEQIGGILRGRNHPTRRNK